MTVHAGARSLPGLLTAVALLVCAVVSPSPAAAADGPAQQASTSPLTKSIPQITRLSGWSAGPARRGVGFWRADGSHRVREVQRLLRRSGYRPGPVDGRFGPLTEAAVVKFQIKHGLRTTGVVGSRTLLTLRERARIHWPPGWKAGPVQRGSGYSRPHGSQRVRTVQRRLNALGYECGRVDGLLGPITERAVENYQGRHGLVVDGVVGRRTLRALGLSTPRVKPRPPRKPAPLEGSPSRPTAPHPDYTLLVFAGLVLLGLLMVLRGYTKTAARIRRARRTDSQPRSLRTASGKEET